MGAPFIPQKEAVVMPRVSILLAVAFVAVVTTISADNYDGIVPEKSGELLDLLDRSSPQSMRSDLADSQISLAQVQKGAKTAAKQAQQSAAGAATKASAGAQKSAQKQAKTAAKAAQKDKKKVQKQNHKKKKQMKLKLKKKKKKALKAQKLVKAKAKAKATKAAEALKKKITAKAKKAAKVAEKQQSLGLASKLASAKSQMKAKLAKMKAKLKEETKVAKQATKQATKKKPVKKYKVFKAPSRADVATRAVTHMIRQRELKVAARRAVVQAEPPPYHRDPLWYKLRNAENKYALRKRYLMLKRNLLERHLERVYSSRLRRNVMRRRIDRLRRLQAERLLRPTFKKFHFGSPTEPIDGGHSNSTKIQDKLLGMHNDYSWCEAQCAKARTQKIIKSANIYKMCQHVFSKETQASMNTAEIPVVQNMFADKADQMPVKVQDPN